MSMTQEHIHGKLITIRTPVLIRKIMIWDMDVQAPFDDTPVYDELYARKDQPDGEEPSDGRSRVEEDGRRGDQTNPAKDGDGG